ncbi:MAG: hypothetical protein IKU86_11750 [Thermoguttaceae bacterium]|nr:hypothetical protein [Thermoguttaceae bacterium]
MPSKQSEQCSAQQRNVQDLFAERYAAASPEDKKALNDALFSDVLVDLKSNIQRQLVPGAQVVRATSILDSTILSALVCFGNTPERVKEIDNLLAYLFHTARNVFFEKLASQKRAMGWVRRKVDADGRRRLEQVAEVKSISSAQDDQNDFDVPETAVVLPASFVEDLQNYPLTGVAQDLFADYPRLTENDKKILLMKMDGFKGKEIAESLGITYDTLNNRRRVIKKYMRSRQIRAMREQGCSDEKIMATFELSPEKFAKILGEN